MVSHDPGADDVETQLKRSRPEVVLCGDGEAMPTAHHELRLVIHGLSICNVLVSSCVALDDVEARRKVGRGEDDLPARLAISALASAFPFFRSVKCDCGCTMTSPIGGNALAQAVAKPRE